MWDAHLTMDSQNNSKNIANIANKLTEGLRILPTDYAARVRNFLAEYLGSGHPIPFGGRARDFEYLDNWLNHASSPYLLLAAPAGRGKSALLLRWCQSLVNRSDIAVAYFPVSIRFRTNLAGVVFPALVALLARLHEEPIPSDPNIPEEVWRGLLMSYLMRPLADGRSLILLLDGVDEAADWTAGPDLFPLHPPPGLHVVLSARYLANDQDAEAWLQRLGWTSPGLAQTHSLYPLDRAGIASVLTQMGFPLDLLGARVDIVSELHRLSEGDPLLVRLYVDDLWERREDAAHLQPEDLRAIHPGLAGYFERWWRDQRILWGQGASQREATAQIVLNLLASALGPLSQQDILSLAPTEFSATELAEHLRSLARFIIGDGMRQGYVFSHPRLANYFLEELLSDNERQEVESRFLHWGKRTLTKLNSGQLPPEQASIYIIQYYGTHLERAQADVPSLLALISDGWRQAWEKLDRASAGFLSDVERAWRAATRENAAATAANRPAPYLGIELHCLLCRVSVNSIASNISPQLMLEAIKTGLWTPAQGLACIRLIADLTVRARELVHLASYVQEPLCTDILQEALDTVVTIKDEYTRLDALAEIAPGLSAGLLWQIQEILSDMSDEAEQSGLLAELAPVLSRQPHLAARTLRLAQEIKEEEYRALALASLAPHSPQDLHPLILHAIHSITEERYRALALTALIPHMTENLLLEVLQATYQMQDRLSQVRLLTTQVTYLPPQIQHEVIQEVLQLEREIDDREYRVEMLVKLAPFLPEEMLEQALQEVQHLRDESQQARALTVLFPYLSIKQLSIFQQAALSIRSEEHRITALLPLLSRPPENFLKQLLEHVPAIWDEGCRSRLLAALAPNISESLFPQWLEAAQALEDHGYRVWLLAELEAPLGGKLQGANFDIVSLFQTIENKEDRLQTLLAILPRLSDRALARFFEVALSEIFDFSWALRNEEDRAHILTKLCLRLPENWLPRLLTMVSKLTHEVYQAQVLVALAPRLRTNLLARTLDIVRAMKEREQRAQVLETLISSLSDEEKSARVQEMLQVLQIIKDEANEADLLAVYISFLPARLPSARIQSIVLAIEAMHNEENQIRILKKLVPHLPEELFANALTIIQKMAHQDEQAQVLEALASSTPGRFFLPVATTIQAIKNERARAHALTTMIAHAPEEGFAKLLDVIQNIQNEAERSRVLTAAVTHAPHSLLFKLWQAGQTIYDTEKRMWVLGALALREPERFFYHFWASLHTLKSKVWQRTVLKSLATHMSPGFFSRLWDIISNTSDPQKYLQLMNILAPYVPEDSLPQFLVITEKIPNTWAKTPMLEALASRLPEQLFPQFFEAMLTFPDKWMRAEVLTALAARLPAQYFPQLWGMIQEMPGHRAQMLEMLAARVPEEFLQQFLQAVQIMPDKRSQARTLTILATRIPASIYPQFRSVLENTQDAVFLWQVIAGLLPHLPQIMDDLLKDLLKIIQKQQGQGRVAILKALLPHLSPVECSAIEAQLIQLDALYKPEEQILQVDPDEFWLLIELTPYLPEQRLRDIFPAVLREVQTIKLDEDRAQALTKLASCVPEEWLNEMSEAIWSITSAPLQKHILSALLPTLSQDGWITLLTTARARAHELSNPQCLLELLQIAGPQIQPSAALYAALHEIFLLLAQQTRRETLADLTPLAPAISALGGEEAIADTFGAILKVGYWWS